MNNLPVLFIPGTLCTPAVFTSQVKEMASLAATVKTVQFTTEDSISKMAETAIELISPQTGAAVIGFSMGGMVAMEIVRKAPELIKKLALLNTNFHADLPGRQSARQAHLEIARNEGIHCLIQRIYLDSYLFQPTKRAAQLITGMAIEMGADSFEAQADALGKRRDSSDTLPLINCPTLIVGAEQDRLCPPPVQLQMQRMIPDSELLMLENCGHFSMLEKPGELNQALRKWYL